MKISTRNNRIQKSKLSIKKLSLKYNLSYERTRQIVQNHKQREKDYILKIKKEYSKNVKKIVDNNLQQEIKRLSNKGRNKKIIIQKVILIQCLKNNFGYSFLQIARLFKNDYTTIRHLYSQLI